MGSRDRYSELILYLARESEQDPTFGATKLAKLLLFCDIRSLQAFGHTLTGDRYQKLPHGPAPRAFLPRVKEMEEERRCAWAERNHYGRKQKILTSLVEPDLNQLTAEELHLVDTVLGELRVMNGTKVSELSHELLGWQLAEDREDVPLESVFVSKPGEFFPEETAFARELEGQAGAG